LRQQGQGAHHGAPQTLPMNPLSIASRASKDLKSNKTDESV